MDASLSLKSKEQLDFFSQNDPYVNIKYGEDSRRTHTKCDSNIWSWSDIMLFTLIFALWVLDYQLLKVVI